MLRVEFNAGNPFVVPPQNLQEKSTRYYIEESINLQMEQVLISELDLTIDNGQIVRPFKPTMRFSTPVFNSQGQKTGILIISYLGERTLEALEQESTASPGQFLLVNGAGYWLKGLTPEDEWGFMVEERQDRTLTKQFPEVWQQISSQKGTGHIKTSEGLFIFSTLSMQEEVEKKTVKIL